ncbi:MAG: calcium/sodium antiporter [Planctomycetes bacterium]|nr:calcium/sodium antiporter [Planctomycetota bacterium]
MSTTILMFALGLALLVCGAEALVRGAVRLAAAAGVSPLVIGLTVVAYGTSAPEMAISVKTALAGEADLSLGNVVGSNIFNVLFILGASAAITPLVVSRQLLRFDLWVMLGVSGLTYLLGADGCIGRLDGLFLATGATAYTTWSIWQSRRENAAVQGEFAKEFGRTSIARPMSVPASIGLVLLGLGLLVLGARWLVAGAVGIAASLDVSELVIGLTIVAAGTSLPEVATSIIAAIRGERDIAVGNVVGSSIFNILAVLGVAAAVGDDGVFVSPAALRTDIPIMIIVAAACLPIFYTGRRIDRWEGWMFLSGYAAYMVYLIWSSTVGAATA